MSGFVTFKGRSDGILVILSKDAPFESVLDELKGEIAAKEKFFSSGELRLSFGGRSLSRLEKSLLVHEMWKAAGDEVNIVFEKDENAVTTGFHRGIVRSGQKIFGKGSLVILGDVNPGGEVSATENIVVLGSLRGMAHAGCSGDRSCVVSALSLQAAQIRIADIYSMAPGEFELSGEMEIAYVSDGKIIVEAVKK